MRSTSAAFCGVLCALLVTIARAQSTPTTSTSRETFCSNTYPQNKDCYELCISAPDHSSIPNCPVSVLPENERSAVISTTSSTTSASSTSSSVAAPASISSPAAAPVGTGSPAAAPVSGETAGTTPTSSTRSKGNPGAVAGGVVAGVVFVALLAGAFFFWRRRRQRAASTRDFDSLEKSIVSSPSVYPAPITPYNVPSPPPQLYQGPAITPVESHHLMGGYSELSQQHRGGEVVPAVGAAKYAAGNQREVDEDGVSLRSPSPVQDGSRTQEARDSVPRLPIYNRGSEIADRGPAL